MIFKIFTSLLLIPKYTLWVIFKFDFWHVTLARARKYPSDIADYLNSQRLNSLCEIGCGLGDISMKVKANKKLGIDISHAVISAARVYSILKMKKLTFQVLDPFSENLEGNFDAIIIVNWIHNIAPKQLKKLLENLCNKNLRKDGRLILDIVDNKEYRNNHDIKYLTSDIDCEIEEVSNYQMGRRIYSVILQ